LNGLLIIKLFKRNWTRAKGDNPERRQRSVQGLQVESHKKGSVLLMYERLFLTCSFLSFALDRFKVSCYGKGEDDNNDDDDDAGKGKPGKRE
jgi:hypothetical protein